MKTTNSSKEGKEPNMTTQQSDGTAEQITAHETFRQRAAQVDAAIGQFAESADRSPTDREVADLVRTTRPDKVEAFELPPDAHDQVREYYTSICIKALAFCVLYLMFLLGLLGLATLLAVQLGWISPDALGP
jgi:hypothetical protein